MKRAYIFALTLVVFTRLPVSATIINIPDDYPTIQQGIDASTDGDTVLVQPGTYVENINFNGHNIALGSLFLMTADTSYISTTIIDGNELGSVVTFENWENNTCLIKGFTIRNGIGTIHFEWYRNGGGIFCYYASPAIENNIIVDNNCSYLGGGIFCEYSNAAIRQNTILGNSADGFFGGGGGIAYIDANLSIENNIIMENECQGDISQDGLAYGGGIYGQYSTSTIVNNIICMNNVAGYIVWGGGVCLDNSSDFLEGNIIESNGISCPQDNGGAGGGIACYGSAPIIPNIFANNVITRNSANLGGGFSYERHNSNFPILINNIFWRDTATVSGNELFANDEISVTYCNVQGGWEGEGNIDADPLFRNPENGDFHLMSTECGDPYDSPCMDAGDPSIFDSILDCDWGLGTERSDMGAYGGEGIPTDVDEEQIPGMPREFVLSQNYPNPFNAQTTIKYTLPRASYVTVDIYDILGRKIETLIQGEQVAGYRQVVWNAEDASSGIFFYRIQAGEYAETRKMVVLK